MNLFDFNKKVNLIDPHSIFRDKVNDHLDDILSLNKDQLMEGKTNKGNNVKPSYSEDTYFKSRNSAENYKNWKNKITYDPRRDPDSPNMFINGAFHKTIFINFSGNIYIIDSTSLKRNDILGKFKDILGLYPKNKEKIKTTLLNESWSEVIKKLK